MDSHFRDGVRVVTRPSCERRGAGLRIEPPLDKTLIASFRASIESECFELRLPHVPVENGVDRLEDV